MAATLRNGADGSAPLWARSLTADCAITKPAREWVTLSMKARSAPFLEVLEAVRHGGSALDLVCELSHEERERLEVTSNVECADVHRIEPYVANEASGDTFRVVVVTTVGHARAPRATTCLVHGEEHLARHSTERRDNGGFRQLRCQLLGARRSVTDNQAGVVRVHGERARDDDLTPQRARLLERVVDTRPVHREEQRFAMLRRLAWRAGSRVLAGVVRQRLELRSVAGVAERHLVPSAGEDRPELSAHEPRTQNADSHAVPLGVHENYGHCEREAHAPAKGERPWTSDAPVHSHRERGRRIGSRVRCDWTRCSAHLHRLASRAPP